jgi:(E)-4-hydroxy-3-methylbut-2-enyl-diphosphate synthase
MSHYGDTPEGMVESAMEFMRMCEDLNYYNLVISMKSSNPQVMVQAYRLLVATMVKEGMNYPLHLGVTEAGDGEDGRIKSAVGIGALLEDGLGDTIRVSLTEEPEAEAPVAIALANRYAVRELSVTSHQPACPVGRLPGVADSKASSPPSLTTDSRQLTTDLHSPYEYTKRITTELNTFIGGHQVPRVIIDLSTKNLKDPAILSDVGYIYSPILDKYNMGEQSTDFVYLADELPSFSFPGNLKQLYNYSTWKKLQDKTNCHPLYTLQEYIDAEEKDLSLNLVSISNSDIGTELFGQIQLDNTLVFVLETTAICGLQDQREAFFSYLEMGVEVPVIIKRSYQLTVDSGQLTVDSGRLTASTPASTPSSLTTNNEQLTNPLPVSEADKFQLHAATDIGGLMLDGFGDGIWLDAPGIWPKTILTTSFGILQATRSRISKTEYISCPSCGRTLFDLQITTQMIRSRTDHLKGLKIGIMGCIVNGPGEMADADYGYVGTGPGKITLYRGKEVVKKNVNTENALDELIGIIREDGNWMEPEIVGV